MARECPKCKRPNNERAPRCLYCGTAFSEPVAPARAEQAEQEKKPPEAYLVVVSPGQKPGDKEIAGFGAVFGMDVYTARQKLQHPAPWVGRVFPTPEAAQELAGKLVAMGLDSYVVKQSGIDKVSDRVQAAALKEISPAGITLIDAAKNEIGVAYNDLFLIVKGRIREKPEREQDLDEETPAVKLGKMAVGAQGSQKEKSVARQTLERLSWKPRPGLMRWVLRGQAIEIMDVYRRSSPRAVRLVESEFDYRGLGGKMSPSGLINFNIVFDAMAESAPHCIIDATFNLVGYTMSETPKEDKIRDRLESVLGASESARKLLDNRAYFDDFSARMYLHYLRENSRKKS